MTREWATKSFTVLLAAVAVIGLSANTARAQLLTYVSASGDDANDCTSFTTTCRSFAGALGKVVDGGMIVCVNPSAYYGHLAIDISIGKSVAIDCLAGSGGVHLDKLSINAPGKTIRLRNLVLGHTGAANIINILAAGGVHLENVHVRGSSAAAILDHRTGPGKLIISDSTISRNSGAGIVVAPISGIIGAVLDNVRATDNLYGVAVGVGGRVMITRSVFSWNSVTGIHADAGAVIDVNDTLVSHNQNGILGNANVTLSNSGINSNTNGIVGTTRSYGNNRIVANSNPGTAPIPVGSLLSENGLQ